MIRTRVSIVLFFILLSFLSFGQENDYELFIMVKDNKGDLINSIDCGPLINFSYNQEKKTYEIVYSIDNDNVYIHFKYLNNKQDLILLGDHRDLIFNFNEQEDILEFISKPKDNLIFVYRIEKNSS